MLYFDMYFHRKSIRLKKYDYSEGGCYFVTIDIQDKLQLFWDKNEINEIGKMIDYWWNEIPNHFKNIEIDEYIIMSDHFHGIIVINFPVGADRCVRPMDINNYPKFGDIVQWFKTMTTNEYIKNVKNNSWPSFHKRLWQRDYYERIIRNKEELNRIRKYIIENPINI
jgi:REP element-mobilizing transposase RayT